MPKVSGFQGATMVQQIRNLAERQQKVVGYDGLHFKKKILVAFVVNLRITRYLCSLFHTIYI